MHSSQIGGQKVLAPPCNGGVEDESIKKVIEHIILNWIEKGGLN
jgi:hypothetical protein